MISPEEIAALAQFYDRYANAFLISAFDLVLSAFQRKARYHWATPF
jgi:hypothetical protein